MKNSVQLRKVTLLCFSKTHEFCISKAAFTISFFAAVSHNYDHKQWTLKHRNTQNRSKSTYHISILNPLKQTSNSEGVHWDDWQQRRTQKSAGFWTSEFMRFWKARLSVERKAGGILATLSSWPLLCPSFLTLRGGKRWPSQGSKIHQKGCCGSILWLV